MNCVECGRPRLRTLETRARPGGLRRRRECEHCGHTFTTVELPDTVLRSIGARVVERAVDALLRGIKRRAAAREARALITQRLLEGWKPDAIAHEAGVSAMRVYQLHKELRRSNSKTP